MAPIIMFSTVMSNFTIFSLSAVEQVYPKFGRLHKRRVTRT